MQDLSEQNHPSPPDTASSCSGDNSYRDDFFEYEEVEAYWEEHQEEEDW
jgi:hypothetical protein